MKIKRGEIHLARLAQKKSGVTRTRPVLVISNNIANTHSGTVTVLPLSSQHLSRTYPFEVVLPKGAGNLSKAFKVKTDQIRTLDRTTIVKYLGTVDDAFLLEIEKALRIHLAL